MNSILFNHKLQFDAKVADGLSGVVIFFICFIVGIKKLIIRAIINKNKKLIHLSRLKL